MALVRKAAADPPEFVKATLKEPLQHYIKEWQLNEKQAMAFCMIGKRFLDEYHNDFCPVSGNKPIEVEQLLGYVGGVGGTGKSFLIKALRHLFTDYGKPEWLYVVAPTSAA